MAAETTKIVGINSAGAYVHIFSLVPAARAAAGQPQLPTSAARRLTFIASANARITTDPIPNPVGILLEADVPHYEESGNGCAGEDIRHWFIKMVGDLEIIQEY